MMKIKSWRRFLAVDFIETKWQLLDKDSLVYKIFCLCIYGSFGGLYPYLALYFKQLGLGAHQSGTVIGTRPLVQCLGAPFWGALSDKFKVGRFILVGSISAWLLKVLLILTITPHKQHCISIYRNQSQNAAFIFVDNLWGLGDGGSTWATLPSGELVMTGSNLTLDYPVVVQKKRLIKLNYKNGKKERAGNQEQIIGDTSKLQFMRDKELSWDNPELHRNTMKNKEALQNRSIVQDSGPKRKYKAVVEQSKKISKATEHLESRHKAITATVESFEPKLGTNVKYITQIDKQEVHHIFIIFTLIIIIGEFLESPTFALSDASLVSHLREKKENYGKVRMFGSVGAAVSVLLVGFLAFKSRFDLCHVVQHNYIVAFYVYSGFVSAALFTVFGFTFKYPEKSSKGPTIKEAASLLFNIADMSFLTAAWFAGICYGFLVHYVNWYMDDLQGNSVIMGAAGASREIAGFVFFFLEGSIIRQFGHVLVMACGLFIYSTSLCLYSLLSNPLMAVILEAFNGATYALVWSVLLNYFNTAGKQLQSPAVLQGILQAVFWGLGNGGGTIIGGALYHHYGPITTFRVFAVMTLFTLLIFLLAQYFTFKQRQNFGELEYTSVGQVSRDNVGQGNTSRELHSLFGEEDLCFDEDEIKEPFEFLNKK